MIEKRRPGRLMSYAPLCAAVLSLVAGVTVLMGWFLDIPELRVWLQGQVSMKANTAFGFVLAGMLTLVARYGQSSLANASRWALESLIFTLGLLTLSQYLFNIDLHLDELLTDASSDVVLTTSPGRMAPTTAIGFMLFALALVVDHVGSGAANTWSRSFAVVLLIVSSISLLGYVYGAPSLYLGIDGVTAMAVATSALFLALSVGVIWLRPSSGFPALLADRSLVGTQSRALMPIVVGAPLLVGALVSAGYGRLYEGQFAIALTALGSVVTGGIIAVVSIIVLRRANAALTIRDRALASIGSGVLITDHRAPDEPIIYANRGFTDITGYLPSEVLGRNCRFMNQGVDDIREARNTMQKCIEAENEGVFELRNRRKDGQIFWNRLSIAPVKDVDNKVSHFVGVIDDVTTEREHEFRLAQALQDARAASSARDTFVRVVSHELRTPLNSALTWIRLLEVDDRPETRDRCLDVVARSIDSQSRLIDDLVDVTQLHGGGVTLELEDVDVRDLAERTIEELRQTIEPDKRIRLDIRAGEYTIRADSLRVRQILRNLITNANKYTPAGGHIEVGMLTDEEGIVIEVADTGKGLSVEEIERIFEPFWRAESNQPGLGVGLSIVADLVEAHEGSIAAASDGHGKGASFTVRLPRKR